MHLSIVSGTVGRAADPREIDWAKLPLGQRFDRQLYPASEEIDNPSMTFDTFLDSTILRLLLSFVTMSLYLDSGYPQSVKSMIQFLYMESTFIYRLNEIDSKVERN